MSLADKLAAPQVRNLVAYQSARRIGGIGSNYLNANESPYPAYGMPEAESWQRYPDFLPKELATRYGLYAGTPVECVLATRGADEGIDLLVRAFCEPGRDSIVTTPPTYSMYDFIAEAHRVERVEAPLKAPAFSLDPAALMAVADRPKLIFLCHPNNPTGNLLKRKELLALAEHYRDRALLVIDEAYVEFSPEDSLVPEITAQPNLVVLRTLSKAFGLAAVRIGFVLANPDVIELLAKLIAPYPIPDPCARIALDALSDKGLAHMETQRDRIVRTRTEMARKLKALPCVEQVYPSVANFLLLKFHDGQGVFDYLTEHGIIPRDQSHGPGMANHLRITIGDEADMQQLLDRLAQVK